MIEIIIPGKDWSAINEDEGDWYGELVAYLNSHDATSALSIDYDYDTDGAFGETRWTDENGKEWNGKIDQESEYASRHDDSASVRYVITMS